MTTKLGIYWTIFLGIVAVSLIPALEAQAVSGALPKGCAESDIAKYGRPFMFSRRGGVATGVSVAKTRFKADEKILVHIWISNESTTKKTYAGSCCEQTFLLYFRVLDGLGNSIPSKIDPAAIGQPGWGCGCSSGLISVPHGFCGVIDKGILNSPYTAYALSPGTYTIVERRYQPAPALGQTETSGLALTVEP